MEIKGRWGRGAEVLDLGVGGVGPGGEVGGEVFERERQLEVEEERDEWGPHVIEWRE